MRWAHWLQYIAAGFGVMLAPAMAPPPRLVWLPASNALAEPVSAKSPLGELLPSKPLAKVVPLRAKLDAPIPVPLPPQVDPKGNFTFTASLRATQAVALTFDDGPDPVAIPIALEILAEHNVQATFFLVGERVKQWPEQVREIVKQGHEVAGHGYRHVSMSRLTPERAWREQIEPTQDALFAAAGVRPSIYRPPYGAITNKHSRYFGERGLHTILWSVDSLDWKNHNPDVVHARVMRSTQGGGIILLHTLTPHRKALEALPRMIKDLKARGYTFQTVGQLLGIGR